MIKDKFRAILALVWCVIACQNFYAHNTAMGALGVFFTVAYIYFSISGVMLPEEETTDEPPKEAA